MALIDAHLVSVDAIAFAPASALARRSMQSLSAATNARTTNGNTRLVLPRSALPSDADAECNHEFPSHDWQDQTLVLPSGFTLAVRIWGDPQASPQQPHNRWLALHGWADNAASFDRLAPLLLREGASAVVAIDAAGHGLSQHRLPSYHDEDDVADVVAVAKILNWTQFSLIGHSLGGCVAQTVTAMTPDHVVRLVLLDSLGWIPEDGPGALARLRLKSFETATATGRQMCLDRGVRMCCGQSTTFPDLEACAQHRATQSIAGPMSIDIARVLVGRGTQASSNGKGFVWTADPGIMQTRVPPSEPFMDAVVAGIKCPQAIVLARDGLFERCNLPRLPFYSVGWCVVVCIGYWIMASAHKVKGVFQRGPKHLRREFPLTNPTVKVSPSSMAFLYFLLMRWRNIRLQEGRVMFVTHGGHRVHLGDAESVMEILQPWLKATAP